MFHDPPNVAVVWTSDGQATTAQRELPPSHTELVEQGAVHIQIMNRDTTDDSGRVLVLGASVLL